MLAALDAGSCFLVDYPVALYVGAHFIGGEGVVGILFDLATHTAVIIGGCGGACSLGCKATLVDLLVEYVSGKLACFKGVGSALFALAALAAVVVCSLGGAGGGGGEIFCIRLGLIVLVGMSRLCKLCFDLDGFFGHREERRPR